MSFPRLTLDIYLTVFCGFFHQRQIISYLHDVFGSKLTCYRCRIGWSVLSHLELSKGGSEKGQVVWNQVLLMARHGAK